MLLVARGLVCYFPFFRCGVYFENQFLTYQTFKFNSVSILKQLYKDDSSGKSPFPSSGYSSAILNRSLLCRRRPSPAGDESRHSLHRRKCFKNRYLSFQKHLFNRRLKNRFYYEWTKQKKVSHKKQSHVNLFATQINYNNNFKFNNKRTFIEQLLIVFYNCISIVFRKVSKH